SCSICFLFSHLCHLPPSPLFRSFDRQASFRKTFCNNDSLSRRPRKLSRRKTVTGIPGDVNRKAVLHCWSTRPAAALLLLHPPTQRTG
uniref:Uncharacterized protein n=1 Tax=Echeneis naucrates TaxID=173247 RepID=A0A665WBR2_ECHNA